MQSHPARWAPLVIAAAAALSACQRESSADLMTQAQAAYAKQQYAVAVIRTKTVLQKTPSNGPARLLLGQALLATGQPAAAAVELRKALEFNVPAAQATPALAKALLQQGDANGVVQQFGSTTLADAQASADLKTTLASAYAALGRRDTALETVQSALKEWPQHEPASLLLARLTASGGDGDGAIAIVDAILQKKPKDIAALLLKGDLQRLAKHDLDGALASYRAAEVADPGSVAAHVVVVGLLLDRHDIEGAKADFAQLKKTHPNHPETRLLEAKLAYIDKDFAKVREICAALLKFYPGDVRVLQLAGAAEYRLDSMTMAETVLSQAVKAAPNLVAPRQLLAQTYLRTGQPKRAVDVLRPIVESRTPDAASLTLTGQAHLQDGDAAAAQADFERATTIDPRSTTARTALALGELSKGNV
ncbi:MAG: tetratricopeptide repeat protein, partial [Burkholderiales bacterium]|nr:tetratricopeptide repeat protein [Burkholderiales bacterium]